MAFSTQSQQSLGQACSNPSVNRSTKFRAKVEEYSPQGTPQQQANAGQ